MRQIRRKKKLCVSYFCNGRLFTYVTAKCKHILEISNESLKIYEEYRSKILGDTVIKIKLKT